MDAAPAPPAARTPLDVLKEYFGYSSFRNCQEAVIDGVLAGRDQLVVMATGGGKSLCYQVPPLVLRKPAVVVSPLISLMEDQVLALQARGVRACFLGSAQASAQVTADAWDGAYAFVYMTPELAVRSADRLRRLRDTAGLALVAVDEAHCISEWGFDFRPEFRQLGELRQALAGTPFLGLTATATPKVRDDIARNLCLAPGAGRHVMSFERPNLHFSVSKKRSPMGANFEALGAEAARGALGPTIVYTLTRAEVRDVAACLEAHAALRGRVGAYSADLPHDARRAVHGAFMRDELLVVVATVAFGMGIDKGNVRRVVHWGAPASLEAYYQQAGRAGRDGLPSRCDLLFSHADAGTNSFIKQAGSLSAAGAQGVDAGLAQIGAYCATGGCRHAAMVEHFAGPGGFVPGPHGRCTGGCDNCDARAAGGSPDADVAAEARQLLAVVDRLNGHGLSKSVAILRGSRAKDLHPWMLEMRAPWGAALHGAGAARSEAWWKGLAGLLMAAGFVAYQSKASAAPGGRSFTVVVATERGRAFLRASPPAPLVLQLPGDMLGEERRRAAAAAAAEAARAAADAARGEEQRLFDALVALRRELAAAAQPPVAPTLVVGDAAVWEIARRRPDSAEGLRACEGCTAAFIARYGRAFADAVVAFCRTSTLNTAPAFGAPAGGAAAAAGAGAGWNRKRSLDAEPGSGPRAGFCAQAAVLLSEPKGAAMEAHSRWAAGQSCATIATTDRPRPIAVQTVVGYLADAGNAGLPLEWGRLVAEAGLAEGAARGVAAAVLAHGGDGLGAVKRACPDADYGAIKLVAALMNRGVGWFAAPAPEQQENEPQYAPPGDKRARVDGEGAPAAPPA